MVLCICKGLLSRKDVLPSGRHLRDHSPLDVAAEQGRMLQSWTDEHLCLVHQPSQLHWLCREQRWQKVHAQLHAQGACRCDPSACPHIEIPTRNSQRIAVQVSRGTPRCFGAWPGPQPAKVLMLGATRRMPSRLKLLLLTMLTHLFNTLMRSITQIF